MTNVELQAELDQAIEKWREVWKSGDMDRVVQLYAEDVRVMRSGRNIVVGREQLRPTLQQFQDMGLADIQFYSDEVGGITTNSEHSQVYQRYHEVVVREDGSEIATIYGLMIWKKVRGAWLIDVYSNCPVPTTPTDTHQLLSSIQSAFNQLGQAWETHSIDEALRFYCEDCLFVPPGERLKGKGSIREFLGRSFARGYGKLTVTVESVLPVFEVYIISHLVHVTFSSFTIADGEGKVVVSGCGNAIVKRVGSGWEITEALWTAIP